MARIAVAAESPPVVETFADLHDRLGCVPLERICLQPLPGTATEADVLVRPNGNKRLVELVDGVLVLKPAGFYESVLEVQMIFYLGRYMETHDRGILLGSSAPFRLKPGLVRLPDVAYVAWDRFPEGELPEEPILDGPPDLALEVLGRGNTEQEMERKLEEYFSAGARLVWYVYPETRTAKVYSSPQEFRILHEDDALDGGDVLPGFRVTIREWFERARTGANTEAEGEAS
jgi:Uma2 family endonuclease